MYGYLCENSNGEICIQEIVRKVVDGFAVPSRLHPVNPDTIGQYTGLQDRNGQDVYEGDLLRTSEGNIMIAEWVGSGIVTRCLTPTYDGMMNTNRHAFPVSEKIGTIHDNPELLEDGK